MPRNRKTQPEAERRAALIAAADEQFVRHGYDATSMARIAAAAGVTPNTLYWYFREKDELLVAVLDGRLQEDLQLYALEAARAPAAQKLIWVMERLQPLRGIVATVHSRIASSATLRAWHDHFHALFEGLLHAEIPRAWNDEQRAAEVRVVTFTLEGLLAHDVDAHAVRATCRALALRWQREDSR